MYLLIKEVVCVCEIQTQTSLATHTPKTIWAEERVIIALNAFVSMTTAGATTVDATATATSCFIVKVACDCIRTPIIVFNVASSISVVFFFSRVICYVNFECCFHEWKIGHRTIDLAVALIIIFRAVWLFRHTILTYRADEHMSRWTRPTT